jgi:hypothetical protein
MKTPSVEPFEELFHELRVVVGVGFGGVEERGFAPTHLLPQCTSLRFVFAQMMSPMG